MSARAPYKIGIIQMRMAQSRDDNLRAATHWLHEAKKQGVQIACLPELFLSPYFCQTENQDHFAWAESVPGASTDALSEVAKQLDMVIIASLFEKRDLAGSMYHNTSVVIDADGQYLGKYRKMHIPEDPRFYEKFYFTPGDLGFKNFDTKYGKIGVLICWDQWFPEAARLTAMQGAEVIFCPTAIGWLADEKAEFGEVQRQKWQAVQRGHAVANHVFFATPNRIGIERAEDNGEIEFFGHSFIYDYAGREIAHAAADAETILTAIIDPTKIQAERQIWPFFRDRRIEHYDGLLKHPGE
jgi:N-carbamoylputrescine amidase